jgi:hypothetical protein
MTLQPYTYIVPTNSPAPAIRAAQEAGTLTFTEQGDFTTATFPTELERTVRWYMAEGGQQFTSRQADGDKVSLTYFRLK